MVSTKEMSKGPSATSRRAPEAPNRAAAPKTSRGISFSEL
jgi:hypothetical protein